jgi:hypothetical protein
VGQKKNKFDPAHPLNDRGRQWDTVACVAGTSGTDHIILCSRDFWPSTKQAAAFYYRDFRTVMWLLMLSVGSKLDGMTEGTSHKPYASTLLVAIENVLFEKCPSPWQFNSIEHTQLYIVCIRMMPKIIAASDIDDVIRLDRSLVHRSSLGWSKNGSLCNTSKWTRLTMSFQCWLDWFYKYFVHWAPLPNCRGWFLPLC